ncbi:CcdB family protein [Oceaniserpentilla sp. 4NH20-0058]|uniref:CcdB family protein n=1 Tax=Oceaniserpentilla sp. 4NH20-0058 TaxID=3127660 RepID=UPI0031040C08
MAQFDVYPNLSRQTRNLYPYIVDIQNSIISDISTRIVIPLARAQGFNHQGLKELTPEIEYEGEALYLMVPQIVSMPAKSLQNPVGSLSHHRSEIIAALDFAITGM